jgi:hypothetical protein
VRDIVTGHEYTLRADGLVAVRAATGEEGVFSYDGSHVSGELRHADHHYIQWVHDTAAKPS